MRPLDTDRGARIRQLRKDRSRTQKQVAAEVGVSERAYQAWEAGKPIDGPHVIALARVSDSTPDFILDGREGGDLADDTGRRLDMIEARILAGADVQEMFEQVCRRFDDGDARLSEIQERIGELAAVLPDLIAEVRELRLAADALRQPGAADSRSSRGS